MERVVFQTTAGYSKVVYFAETLEVGCLVAKAHITAR